MKNYKSIILLILVVLFGVLSLYFYKGRKEANNLLKNRTTEIEKNERQLQTFNEFQFADSLLYANNLKDALKNYSAMLDNVPDSFRPRVKQRIAFVNRVIAKNLTINDLVSDTASQTPNQGNVIKAYETVNSRKLDSMQFALKKASMKIQNLQRQVKQQTTGDYLSFKSGKGNTVYYVGEIKNDMANGKGIALFGTGSRYEGEWKNNLRHGKGAFYWQDGEYYIGSYKDDKREGFGEYNWPNGEKYIGEWSNDKRNGKGTFYDEDGKVMTKGIWKNDELVEQSEN